jgi:3-oxoacyl-[acyl-carrier-protein] synthase II
MRRVVVTGLGAITPLGLGIRRTWTRLIAGESGIVSVAEREPRQRWRELTCTVAGVVPQGAGGRAHGVWRADDWLSAAEQRRMSLFTQYAIAASDMALEDAGWNASRLEDQEATGVCLGSGIGNLEEMYETSLSHSRDVSLSTPTPTPTPTKIWAIQQLTTMLEFRDTEKCHHSSCLSSSSTWPLGTSP